MFAANESGLAAAVLANKSGAPSVLAGATQAGRQDHYGEALRPAHLVRRQGAHLHTGLRCDVGVQGVAALHQRLGQHVPVQRAQDIGGGEAVGHVEAFDVEGEQAEEVAVLAQVVGRRTSRCSR